MTQRKMCCDNHIYSLRKARVMATDQLRYETDVLAKITRMGV